MSSREQKKIISFNTYQYFAVWETSWPLAQIKTDLLKELTEISNYKDA